MQRTLKQSITESPILRSALVFLLAYVVMSVLWLQIKDSYGYGVTFIASKIVAGVKGARLEELSSEKGTLAASFSSVKGGRDSVTEVTIKVSPYSYSFSVPLTLSLLITLSPFIKRKKRAYSEALLIFFLFHLLNVFFSETLQLTNVFMTKGIEKASVARLSIYQFLWGITDYASISFAPFLVVFYTFLRFRR